MGLARKVGIDPQGTLLGASLKSDERRRLAVLATEKEASRNIPPSVLRFLRVGATDPTN